jgi:hypothetical protein
MSLRRQFDLWAEDEAFLGEYGLPWETVKDGSLWVLVHNFPTGTGYNHASVTAAIRIETGYPTAQLDMVYFSPTLLRSDGATIACATVVQPICGVPFQRWSRHRTAAHPWKPGEDSLGTHIFLIEQWLAREVEK